jgi:predicted nucleic acid-binding protein
MAVLDASVIVALFNSEEPHHEACRNWFVRATNANEPLVAPVVMLAEVAAAISRGAGNPARAQETVDLLVQHSPFELTPVSLTLAEQAATLALTYRIRGGDALYVALAHQLDQPLITLDEQQLSHSQPIIQARRP